MDIPLTLPHPAYSQGLNDVFQWWHQRESVIGDTGNTIVDDMFPVVVAVDVVDAVVDVVVVASPVSSF